MFDLITKYNISETDLYTLGLVEYMKKSSGYSKREKLKSVSLKILKPYKVKFMDLGNLLNVIKKGDFDNKYSESVSKEKKLEIEKMIQEIVEKSNTKFFKDFWSERSKIQKWGIVIGVLYVVGLSSNIGGRKVGNMDPCDCYELFSQEKMIGFSNLQKLNKFRYNDCIKVWDNSRKANDGCLEKMGIQ